MSLMTSAFISNNNRFSGGRGQGLNRRKPSSKALRLSGVRGSVLTEALTLAAAAVAVAAGVGAGAIACFW